MEVRKLLLHMRACASDRCISRDTDTARNTVRRYRRWAEDQGLLSGQMPPDDQLHALLDNTLPPLTPYGRAELDKRIKAETDGKPFADASTHCWPHGIPRVMNSPYPIQIIQVLGRQECLPHLSICHSHKIPSE